MAMQVGTYDIKSLLAARFTSANQYGLDTIAEILQADLDNYNASTQEQLTQLADVTIDVQRIYGSSIGGEMVEVDEYGRSSTQRATPGSTVGFPLKLFQYGIGWTRAYLNRATPADLAIRQQAAQKAHRKAVRTEIRRAIYTPTNSTFKDYLVNEVDVPVKALVNADSASIPDGPDGGSFDAATHTHYNAVNGLTAAALTDTINDVIEHGHGGKIMAAINFNDVAAVMALTGFVSAPDYRIIPATTGAVTRETTNPSQLYNRYIGVFGAAEVWVKPWALQNYIFVWDSADPEKPLAFRQENVGDPLQGLQIAAELDLYPLYAQYMEAKFGVGVWSRTNGAVLYFASGTYAAPSTF